MPLPAPVIMVPGITASNLIDQYPVSTEEVWSAVIDKSYDRIALHPWNLAFDLLEPARVGPSSVFKLPYGELIEALRHELTIDPDEPVPVYAFPYDWRLPLAITQLQLKSFISEVIGRTRLMPHYVAEDYDQDPTVNLVGHSMGGLLIAGLLAMDPAVAGLVDRVVTIGTPYRGATEAVAKVALGEGINGSSASRERESARVTPSLYHLLPSFPGAVAGEAADFLFTADNWQPSVAQSLDTMIQRTALPNRPAPTGRDVLQGMLDAARAHRDAIASLELDAGGFASKDWLAIVGIGDNTLLDLSIDSGGWFDLVSTKHLGKDPTTTRTGDGTVPALGAVAPFLAREQLVCVTRKDLSFFELKDQALSLAMGLHGLLPMINLVQRLTASFLLDRNVGDIWGRPFPGVDPADWAPPMPKLERR